jgi:hypothetical protein
MYKATSVLNTALSDWQNDVGESVGFDEGLEVTESVGFDEGLAVGESVVGLDVVGVEVGLEVVGVEVGLEVVGVEVGSEVVWMEVVGMEVGLELGAIVGMEVGALVGALVVTDTEMVTVTVAAPTVPFKLSTTERRLSFERVPFLLNATVVSFMRVCMKLPSAIDSEISFFTEAFS